MSGLELASLSAKYVIPGIFSMLFRIFGLGARSKRAAAIGMAAYLAVSIAIPLLAIPTLGYDVYKRYAFFVTLLANSAVFIISSDKFLKTCFLHFSQASILFWLGTTLSAVRRMLDLSYFCQCILLVICCTIVFAVALHFWAGPLRFMADTVHSGWLGMLSVPGCTILVGVAVSVWVGIQERYNAPFLILLVSLLQFSFVMYLCGLYHTLLQITRLAQENTQKKLLEAELFAYQESLAAAKQTRHDLRHHDAMILDYLQTGNVAGAMDYLSTNDAVIAKGKLTEYSANPAANAALRIYARQAQAEGIAFAAHADFSETISLTAPELGALLSNLMENAVEACRRVAPAERKLSFHAETSDGTLRLEVRNSVACATAFGEDGMPLSTKPGGGTGTKSIAHIVKAHGGMLRFKQEDTEFITQIILPIH